MAEALLMLLKPGGDMALGFRGRTIVHGLQDFLDGGHGRDSRGRRGAVIPDALQREAMLRRSGTVRRQGRPIRGTVPDLRSVTACRIASGMTPYASA
ncbi:hypothetical protein GCM10007874_48100 [Labrys miyagiensis]|uniref:Uncharacterized protein n=1 Tax=Labrys miyagiensis TaxID=346912 RepID=A0ABQ6CN96_9HYPH|nr:hypothetical protein GCM10007874_48100 [Labrys miyagiensis]